MRADPHSQPVEHPVHRLAADLRWHLLVHEDDGVAALFVQCGNLAGFHFFHDDA
jgi:hypothetical protein